MYRGLELRRDFIYYNGSPLARLITSFPSRRYCPICGHPLPRGSTECPLHGPEERVDATMAVGLYYTVKAERSGYGNQLTNLILRLKQSVEEAKLLGAAMALLVREGVFRISDVDVVTYVPKRREEFKVDEETGKRFNQAYQLARAVAHHLRLGKPVKTVRKVKPFTLQGLRRDERYRLAYAGYEVLQNVADRIRDKSVLLVDDVRTSGATANAIAAKLKELGAKKVYLFVAGRTAEISILNEICSNAEGCEKP
ncbi:ComF family protein [Thermoproteus tenax]|uniref:Amidophosphoribosyltransferase (ComF) n=1 Tax=Thermoproteus tenax (strain ATCC 35583 / DSM 2078 / JCM 9277 / NBRC 100435 / Kra 1) TaxID=768679 RepID=G4RMX5_THETK|nr:ComF family protein [Thermoproteus tenax]CCC80919.1 amidophosphoribosyltransferase (comF) [Thermoproteus tenax Kra 1]